MCSRNVKVLSCNQRSLPFKASTRRVPLYGLVSVCFNEHSLYCIITGHSFTTHHILYEKVGWPSLANQREQHCLFLSYKLLSYLSSLSRFRIGEGDGGDIVGTKATKAQSLLFYFWVWNYCKCVVGDHSVPTFVTPVDVFRETFGQFSEVCGDRKFIIFTGRRAVCSWK